MHRRTRETLADWFEYTVALEASESFDLFHGHFVAYAGYVAALAARYSRKKSVVSGRGNDIDVMPFDRRRAVLVIQALRWADVVVTVTHDLARKVAALSGREDIPVIPNGVDASRFTPQAPDPAVKTACHLDDRPVIGFVGEARAKKGLGRLLRIFPLIYERVPVQMLLVGGVRKDDRPMLDFFRRQHPDLPLSVVPPQPNERMPGYYALCDLIVLPSLRDGLPNTLLEAMACGRAVVASAVGGMLDVITDGHNGVLLSPYGDHTWVETLCRLLADPDERARLGTAARKTVSARFTEEQEREQWNALYHALLAR
jgi:glycosyltransferase involved in cell wall biosynthesis